MFTYIPVSILAGAALLLSKILSTVVTIQKDTGELYYWRQAFIQFRAWRRAECLPVKTLSRHWQLLA